MRNPFVYQVGGVVSADIAVPEHERELAFYSAILTTGDAPLWRDDLMNNEGTPVIGLGARTPEYEILPLQWFPHFQVADVAASAASAIELGGKELMHGKTDDGESQWAAILDRDGAAFGIIPVVQDESEPTPQSEPIGRISWLSLTVPDASASRDFYERVIGWTSKPTPRDNDEDDVAGFQMQIDNETSAAEICSCGGEPTKIPPVWLIHIPVDDFAESLRRVTDNGGQVVKECAKANYAVVRDPVGVYVTLQAE